MTVDTTNPEVRAALGSAADRMALDINTPSGRAALLVGQRISERRLSDVTVASVLLVIGDAEREHRELTDSELWSIGRLFTIPAELIAHLTMADLITAGVLPLGKIAEIREQINAAVKLEQIAAEQAQRHTGREQQLQREEIEARLGEVPADPNDVETGEPARVSAIEISAASSRPSDVRRAMATGLLWSRSNPDARVTIAVPAGSSGAIQHHTGPLKPYSPTVVAERTPDQPGNDA
jgi:hypothetical protein